MTAMEQLFLILELVGTLAFAASGAITGLKKNMDVFGVCILGLTTAVGGGVIRDLLLGITPPGTFQDPIYAVVALLTSLVLFLPRIRRPQAHCRRAWRPSLPPGARGPRRPAPRPGRRRHRHA